jgi:cytosine/adenosine deaminase-related metal-dependent hydrolase
MKHFSAQYVFTNSSAPLKRPIITTTDDGTIVSIEDTEGKLMEKHTLSFYNGIIVPGFVNCHCHLELSHMQGKIAGGRGLAGFIADVRNKREIDEKHINQAIIKADNEMLKEGIVICADICNTSLTFKTKRKSLIRYFNFLEVFGINSSNAQKRIDEIILVAEEARKSSLQFTIVPHSVYSVSEHLFHLIKELAVNNKTSSIHFLESGSERVFLESHSGPILDSYKDFGIAKAEIRTVENHIEAILYQMTPEGSLLLVHNTFITRNEIETLKKRKNLYWCLCPCSNLFIEKKVPPIDLLIEEGCEIVIGTDSKGSNENLSILNEMKTIQNYFPSISFDMLINWATLNGARALGEDSWAGSIEPGKKPGLVLIENFDLKNQRLLEESKVKRLI